MVKDTINGSALMLFIDGKSIAHATNHTLSETTETQETASKDYGQFSSKTATRLSWTLTSDNLYTEDFDEIQGKMHAMEPITCYFGRAAEYTKTGLPADASYYTPATSYSLSYGDAVITSLSVNAAAGSNATFSATFEGTGALHTATS